MAARNGVEMALPATDKIRSPHINLPVIEHKDTVKSLSPTTSNNVTSILNLKERDKPHPTSTTNFVDDPRTLQLALELSMVGLSNCDALNSSVIQTQGFANRSKSLHHNFISTQPEIVPSNTLQHRSFNTNQQFDSNALSLISAAVAVATQSSINNSVADFNTSPSPSMSCTGVIEERSKKSQNMTECVPVPSSEHVAEIVGRQGCKIKALRAKTNTYIKTPVRNEEPVFVVTGRKEDVAKAKREIVSAAEHFSFIRATRKHSLICGSNNSILSATGDNNSINPINDCNAEHGKITSSSHGPSSSSVVVVSGQITIQVRVPYRVVGLVVGPKGATIKHIQQETQTYIVTPSREKEPIFEVTGSPENVESARKHIEAHIALRTGSVTSIENSRNDSSELNAEIAAIGNFSTSDNLNTLNNILNDGSNRDIIDTLYRNHHLYTNLHYVDDGAKDGGIFYDNKSENNAGGNPERLPLVNSNITPNLANSITYKKLVNCGKLLPTDSSNNVTCNDEISQKKEFSMNKLVQKKQQRNMMINDLNMASNTNSAGATNAATRSCSSASSTTSSKSANNSTNTNCSRPELLSFWKNLANSLDVNEDTTCDQQPCLWSTSSPHNLSSFNTTEVQSKKTPVRHSITISPTDSLLDETSPSLIASFKARDILAPTSKINPQHAAVENSSLYMPKCVLCNKDGGVANHQRSCGHKVFCKDCVGSSTTTDQHVCPVCNNSAFRNTYT